MAITYNAGTDTITITGYTSGTPCTFLDIYNADVAGSWGQVTRQCTNQYCIDCKLVIGDGSTATYFADEKMQIIFPNGSVAAGARNITLTGNSNFRLGRLINDTRKETDGGCMLFDLNAVTHTFTIGDDASGSYIVELYSTTIIGRDGRAIPMFTNTSASSKLYNCILSNGVELIPYLASLYNIQSITSSYGISRCGGTLLDKITVMGTPYPVYAHSVGDYAGTFKNVVIRNCTYAFGFFYCVLNDQILINPDIDSWSIYWLQGAQPASTAKLWRKYEFDLKVIDKNNVVINGATVKIWDKDSNLVVDTTTNASGVIATQTITRGYYNKVNANTLQEASPHLIKIEKAGYTTYEADFTLEDKVDWLIALQAAGGGLLRNPPMTGGMV